MKNKLSQNESPNTSPKFPHPKILLIDVDPESERILKAEGYNVTLGSFGAPYRVPKSDQFSPVIVHSNLPNYTEQEIVVIDLIPRRILDQAQGEKKTSDGENDWWASCSRGVIDPRPRVMLEIRAAFDRILAHGGIFIVFSAPRTQQKLVMGHVKQFYGLVQEVDLPFDNWCFLAELNPKFFEIDADRGEEILVVPTESPIDHLLMDHIKGASFGCTIEPRWDKNNWFTLAKLDFVHHVT